jgi:LCP family protein required for cell wall assembly
VALVLFVAGAAVSGVYAWRILSAIVEVQKAAVVALPTRASDLPSYAGPDTATPTPASAPTETALPNVRAEPSPGSAPDAATSSQTATPPPPTSTTEPATETPAPTQESRPAELPTGDDPSRLDVIQNIIGQSINDEDPGRSKVWGGKTSLNILLLGVDKRPDGGDQNADVIIIAHVDLIAKKVSAVSLPRDLLIEIPGVGPDKINSAYNHGVKNDPENPAAGVALVRDTVEQNFGVPIDGYVLIDFKGFEEVVDAVGGVEIDVPEEIVDEEYPTEDYGVETVRFEAGRQHMDGEQALKYARTRHGDNDDARRERQFQVLIALFKKAKSIDSITKGDQIILALSDNVQTSFGLEQQLTLARIGYSMTEKDIELVSVAPPLVWEGYTDDGRWVYRSDPTELAAFVNEALGTS